MSAHGSTTAADGPKARPIAKEIGPSAGSDHSIAALAGRQHGVVSLAQLLELGLSTEVVERRIARGRLHRVHQAVYAVGHSVLSANGYRMAAVLACGPDAVLSHRSAAALWGIRTDSRARIDVTAPGRRGRSPLGIDAHRHGSLDPIDRTVIDGIPCTSLAWTLLDIAGVVTPRELRSAIIQAEVLRLFDLTAVREVIGRGRGRRGVACLRLATDEHDPNDERARREFELRFLALCRAARFPPPLVNTPLEVDGSLIEPDFLWRNAALIVEADSHRFHGIPSAFERDRRRDQRLQVAGWTVIRCTWRQLTTDPESLTQTIRTLLNRPMGRKPGL